MAGWMNAVCEQGPCPARFKIDPQAGSSKTGMTDRVLRIEASARPAIIRPFPAMCAGGGQGLTHMRDHVSRCPAAIEQAKREIKYGCSRTEQPRMSGPLQRRTIIVMYLAAKYAVAPCAIFRGGALFRLCRKGEALARVQLANGLAVKSFQRKAKQDEIDVRINRFAFTPFALQNECAQQFRIAPVGVYRLY